MNSLIPIFPLEIVVYPGEELNLHIFEPRYKELINDAAKTKIPFGIPSIIGRKLGGLGTLMQLNEVLNVQADGQMDIRTRGTEIFRITHLHQFFPAKLYAAAEVEYPENNRQGNPKLRRQLVANLIKLHAYLKIKKKFAQTEASLTSYDLAHHIGLSPNQEYEFLGLFSELLRQEYLLRHLEAVLPIVADMEALKEKIKLNGHFKRLPGFDL